MLSIDEAIAKYKEIANTDANCPIHCMRSCDKCVQESEQLVEWLEELKVYRENSNGYTKEDIELNRKAMYNKALDDFIHECDKYCGFYSGKNKNITREDMLKIAEQLKAGGECI